MSPRSKRLLYICLAAIVLAAFFLSFRRIADAPTDPVYGGVPFSTHLYTLYAPLLSLRIPVSAQDFAEIQAQAKKQAASRATLDMVFRYSGTSLAGMDLRVGTEAIPLITNWLAAAPLEGWRLSAAKRLSSFFPNLSANRQLIAWTFLRDYPVRLGDSTLSIFHCGLTNKNRRVQTAAAQAFGQQLRSGMKVDKDVALRLLYPLSSYALSGAFDEPRYGGDGFVWGAPMPEQVRNIVDGLDPRRDLIPLYTLEMGVVHARVGAAEELARNPRYPERAVPLLITNLGSTNRSVIESCACALGAYGPQAQSALPALQLVLEHPRERIRVAASNAISSITAKP